MLVTVFALSSLLSQGLQLCYLVKQHCCIVMSHAMVICDQTADEFCCTSLHLNMCNQVIGAPLAAGLLALDGWLGLAGWQWLFIVEGIPTILMGLYTKVSLAESPAKASFLTPAEKTWLQQRHAESKVCARLKLPKLKFIN